MKKLLLLVLMLVTLPAFADDTKVKAEQIKDNAGNVCFRCEYAMQDGWVTSVTNHGEPWPLKAKEVLYILPLGLRPESILFQVNHVSPHYEAPSPATPTTGTSSDNTEGASGQ